MGLAVKNNRDGKSHTLRFVCRTCSGIKEGGGRVCMGKKVFHTRFSLVKSLVACAVFHFK